MQAYPGIHERVARPGIPPGNASISRDNADIGDTADISDATCHTLTHQLRLMKCGYQWGALSARSHITAPEIGDHGDSCEFGEPAGVPYLQGIGCLALRLVAERLGILRTVVLTELVTTVLILGVLAAPLGGAMILLPVVGAALNGTSSVLYGTVVQELVYVTE